MIQETSVQFWDKPINYDRLCKKFYNALIPVYYKSLCSKNPYNKVNAELSKLEYLVKLHARRKIESRWTEFDEPNYYKNKINKLLKEIEL